MEEYIVKKVYEGKTKDVYELDNGNMRVYKDGSIVDPMELTKIILGK